MSLLHSSTLTHTASQWGWSRTPGCPSISDWLYLFVLRDNFFSKLQCGQNTDDLYLLGYSLLIDATFCPSTLICAVPCCGCCILKNFGEKTAISFWDHHLLNSVVVVARSWSSLSMIPLSLLVLESAFGRPRFFFFCFFWSLSLWF